MVHARQSIPYNTASRLERFQSHELLRVLKQIELTGLSYTAFRAKQRCSRVFRHAVGLGYAERDITVSLRVLLEPPRARHRVIGPALPILGVSENCCVRSTATQAAKLSVSH